MIPSTWARTGGTPPQGKFLDGKQGQHRFLDQKILGKLFQVPKTKRKPKKSPSKSDSEPLETQGAAQIEIEAGEVLQTSQIAEIEALLGLQLAELEALQNMQTQRRESAWVKATTTDDSKKTTTERKDEAKAVIEDIAATKAITEAIAKASNEVRQLEKHKRAIISNITAELEDEILFDFIRDLSRTRREKYSQFLASLDSNNDLLSL